MLFRKIKWFPEKLGNRMFVSVLVFILLPLLIFQWLQYSRLENAMIEQIRERSANQLAVIKESLGSLKYMLIREYLHMEHDPELIALLSEHEPSPDLERAQQFRHIFEASQNRYAPDGVFLRIDLADRLGTVYSSRTGAVPNYHDYIQATEFREAASSPEHHLFQFDTHMTIYTVIPDLNGQPAGWLRLTLDLNGWMAQFQHNLILFQQYAVYDKQGIERFASGSLSIPFSEVKERTNVFGLTDSWIDHPRQSIIQAARIPELQMLLVGQLPLELYFGNLQSIKSQVLLTFGLTVFILMLLAYALSSALTRPLVLLQKRMATAVEQRFQMNLPMGHFRGELHQLALTFTRMIQDLNTLIQKLKEEERQRAAVRFQMLLAQMNPHFLLNTLNTIKLNVMYRDDKETAAICTSLGRLLETSLNGDVDLIHLSDELKLVKAYAHIQNFRYDQRFEVIYEVSDELLFALVPKLSIQPLVENAIIHGLQDMSAGGRIVITAAASGRVLQLIVTDNGRGLANRGDRGRSKRSGIGLDNLRERLQLMFKEEAGLSLEQGSPGAQVIMRMPLLISKTYELGD